MKDMEQTTAYRDVRGLQVEPCRNCGRWSSVGITCCVPCSNGGKHPHAALCEKKHQERTRLPREMHDPRDICPKCDRELIFPDRIFRSGKWRCANATSCGWLGDRPTA